MPLQIPGMYDFGNAYAGAQTQVAGGNFLVNRISGLGSQIAESISLNNMRREADQLAPILGQQYQQGLSAIAGGDISGGLGQIYSTSAIASRNPILQRMVGDIDRTAGFVANNVQKNMMGMNRSNEQMLMMDARNAEWDRRLQAQGTEWDRRRAASQAEAQPLTASQKLDKTIKFQETLNESIDALNAAEDEESFNIAKSSMESLLRAAKDAGLAVERPEVMKYTTKDQRDKIKALSSEISSLEKEKGGWFGFGDADRKEKIKSLKEKLDKLTSISQEALRKEQADTASPDEALALPQDTTGIIDPVVPDASEPLSFSTVEEAEAAGLAPGTEIIIGGRRAVIE